MSLSRRNLLKSSGVLGLGVAVSAGSGVLTAGKAFADNQSPKPTRTPLNQRKLGKFTVSALGLGCQGFGQNMYGVPEPAKEQSVRVIRQAFDHGVTFFDTAEAYGPFKSEAIVGEAIKPFRKQIVLATKYGWDIDQATGQRTGKVNSKPAHIKRVVDNMLKRLQTDYIDLLYQHRADPEVPVEEIAGTMQELMKAGKILGYGLCEVSPQTIRKAHAIAPITAVQSEYSLLFRGRENDVLPVCRELGIGFVPWSPLGMGTLAGYVNENTRFADDPSQDLRGILPRFAPENLAQNAKLFVLIRKWADRKVCTPAQFSLAWLLAQYDGIVPIAGTTKGFHLMENLGANDIVFTDSELQAFRNELEQIQITGERLPEAILKFSEVR
ncbi:aldo/keto reductase [Actinobacillus succinogenes]|uniref:Aldo/keto reductase n=1 Tax=Actinobacillus succinogenes (strain ATCC 55618 / DSM 22257 / CCUG 43843 / 130Z) TaxID=339671 RepID=A6VR43_ACTSZ|nr:aldo/keto reductase [Actinobacillus succinogenes]ABR75440.1 aldo/keto reductase [Actinobacillus succinogenes 130Z]PHI40172.1 aldo/keto reductase [Actinobacillus succinogenes]